MKEQEKIMEKVSLETIRLAQGGDEKAFQEIYQQCYYHVFYYALKLSKNEADAKDIAQETFLQVYRSIHSLQNPDYFPVWLNRILYSKFMRLLNKQKETAIESDDLRYHLDQSDKAKRMNDERLLDDEEIIKQMIQRLTPKQREVMELTYYQQYTALEIAKLLHLPEGTVKSRIHEAKKALKKEIVAFEKQENRKIILHTDVLLPMVSLSLLGKLKSFLTQQSMTQTLMVTSVASMVVVSTVAIKETADVINNVNNQKGEPQTVQEASLPKKSFQPVQYQEKQIDSAKSAYYTLKAWAPDAEHVKTKTKKEKHAIQSILDELLESNSGYIKQLESSGWLEAYNNL